VSDLRQRGRGLESQPGSRRKNSGQVSHADVPLSPSSISWYRRKVGRRPTAGKVTGGLAAQHRVHGCMLSPAGWLPKVRDQLRRLYVRLWVWVPLPLPFTGQGLDTRRSLGSAQQGGPPYLRILQGDKTLMLKTEHQFNTSVSGSSCSLSHVKNSKNHFVMTTVMWSVCNPYKATHFENRKSILHFITLMVLHTDSHHNDHINDHITVYTKKTQKSVRKQVEQLWVTMRWNRNTRRNA